MQMARDFSPKNRSVLLDQVNVIDDLSEAYLNHVHDRHEGAVADVLMDDLSEAYLDHVHDRHERGPRRGGLWRRTTSPPTSSPRPAPRPKATSPTGPGEAQDGEENSGGGQLPPHPPPPRDGRRGKIVAWRRK